MAQSWNAQSKCSQRERHTQSARDAANQLAEPEWKNPRHRRIATTDYGGFNVQLCFFWRAYLAWAAANSPEASAPMMEISPASAVTVQISANLRAVPSPTQPSSPRDPRAV